MFCKESNCWCPHIWLPSSHFCFFTFCSVTLFACYCVSLWELCSKESKFEAFWEKSFENLVTCFLIFPWMQKSGIFNAVNASETQNCIPFPLEKASIIPFHQQCNSSTICSPLLTFLLTVFCFNYCCTAQPYQISQFFSRLEQNAVLWTLIRANESHFHLHHHSNKQHKPLHDFLVPSNLVCQWN